VLVDLAGADLSTGTLKTWVAQAAAGLSDFDEQLRALLSKEPVVHFDETGARIAARLGWVHSASTPELTLYIAHDKRGAEAIDAAGVLGALEGVAVHDGWAPYRRYDACQHALCNAHHLRELVAAHEQGDQSWALGMSALLLDAKDLVEQARQRGAQRLSAHVLAELHASYRTVIELGLCENSDHPGKRSKAHNLLLRLDRHEPDVMRCAHDFRVPFDNNLSERDLRMIKLQQKISGCWRTREGAEEFLRIRSYISTARKQGQHALGVLGALAQGQPWLPAPGPI
jgi:transposase